MQEIRRGGVRWRLSGLAEISLDDAESFVVRDLISDAATIRVPTLVLADSRDTVVPIQTARALCAVLADARLELIERVGHHLPRRAPRAVADAIVGFADSL